MRWFVMLTLAWLALGAALPGHAQMEAVRFHEPPQIFPDYQELLRKEWSLAETSAFTTRTPKLPMFRMPAGFLATPLGIVSDDDPFPDDGWKADDDPGFAQLVFGKHVPFLDMHRRGDPGGVGFYKLHSQMQVFDLGPTNVCVNLHAVTPMGVQAGGVGNGPTVLSPALACFHDLGDGAAVHAYLGQ